MSARSTDKKQQIVTELGEGTDQEGLVATMRRLDNYTVKGPSSRSTNELIALLKPVLQEMTSSPRAAAPAGRFRLPAALRLVQPQAMLLSKWFVAASALVLLAGLVVTNAVNGNTMKYLVNASPILGILTVFYEYRAKLSGVSELEAACCYSPAQLATARLIVVLGYDIVLCLVATPLVSYWQGRLLWQVAVGWFAPLMLMLGIALAGSLRFGIVGGCLISATVWALQFAVSAGGSVFSLLLPKQPAIFADLISLAVGLALIVYSYKRWDLDEVLSGDEQSD